MRRANLILALAVGLAVAAGLAGCGGGSSSASTSAASAQASTPSTTASTPSATASVPAKHACRTVRVPTPKPNGHLSAPHLTLDPHRTYTVKVVTNCGTFAFTLDVAQSPKTSASFYSLVKRGFFDGLTFHRVAAGFVIQGGDPTGTGAGGPGYTVVEAPPKNTQYVLGDVAMAKTQAQPAGASGSQFFIVTAPNVTESAGLTPDYALAGKVTTGISVVEKIGALPTNPPQDGAPTTPVVMSSVTVSTS
ncbi:MAG TPA: peptidylprolyl isomerase [Solirubrobacteraceae bacterium]|nr:peptidylprolyl isomerase [Solirubrobacteraceae bacterium]